MKQYRFALGLAVFTALATYGLILLGGVVHNTGSSLACPDWPLCYGEVFPTMTGGVLYEHSHRLLGMLVGLCSIGLCVTLWRPAPGFAPLRWVALVLLGLVIMQGVLGGITVIYRLPTLVSTAHLATSIIVLMLLVYLCRAAWVRSQGVDAMRPAALAPALARTAFSLLAVTAALVYVQVVLGALVRHTGSSEAAGWGLANAIVGVDGASGLHTLWPRDEPAQLNVLHRYTALLVSATVLLCSARCWVLLRGSFLRGRSLPFLVPVLLVMSQAVAGVAMLAAWNLTIYPGLGIGESAARWVQISLRTAHLGLGALLLLSLFYLAVVVGEVAHGALQPVRGGGSRNLQPTLQPSRGIQD